ncbi:MAG TPA: glycosyltransferase family 9 protein [Stellaceae bacterium]
MMSQAASPPDFPVPLRAGNYSAEIFVGPRGPVAVYRFAFEGRRGRRLLVLKLDHYGDFLIGLPALKSLREGFPGDHITLVCGSWNAELARRLGVADEVRAYDFFPENGALWTGQPFEDLERFREVCSGSFDVAIDLRVDEDTRFLLEHVEAATRCGIGLRARYPFLDVVLPPQFERRESEGRWISIEPDRFESCMPRRTPFFHENDFSVTNTHLVFGPYILLPRGRFRAHFGLRLLSALPRLSRVRLVIDVTRNVGAETVATGRVSWSHRGEPLGEVLEFANEDPGALYEFRIHARGRPIRSRLRFFGVRIELIGGSNARFKRSELHIGEQLSLLVDLIEQRTRTLYARDPFARTPPKFEITGPSASAKRIVISPVSNSELRDWGMENYARLVSLLLDRADCRIVLVGSGAQHRQLERILEENGRDPRITNVAGASDWFGTAEIVRAADLVIANNSGVAHLAAACGTPTLAIYSGSHQPQEWGPRGDGVRAVMALVPCSPCGYDKLEECPNDHLCMKQIVPETIADQAIAMLSDSKSHPHHAKSAIA